MRIHTSLYWRLALAFMLVAFITAALVAFFIRLSSADRLTQLIIEQQRSNLDAALQSYYINNGSWVGVDRSWRQIQFQSIVTPQAAPAEQPNQPAIAGNPLVEWRGRENLLGLADAQGMVVVSVAQEYPVGSQLPASELNAGTTIILNGEQVGTILTARQPPDFNPQESRYLNRVNQALIYASLGALVVALIFGVLLARTLTRPLQALTQAAQSISQGQLEQQVTVKSHDEIGQLAAAFNTMSQEVARSNQLRKQMTADIAHDLRTPLTVISGYIESMRDGVLKPTQERLALIYKEIERLQNLVGDLRTLSLADAGELTMNFQKIEPKALLEHTAALFKLPAEQQQVTLAVETPENLPAIRVDEARMIRVLGNLIENALRYTPAHGQITLRAQTVNHSLERQVAISVQDTGEGINTEELPFIFDRFYRGDKARHSEMNESGLGLAIVKALVESQHGTIHVESIVDQGTNFTLFFPIALPS